MVIARPQLSLAVVSLGLLVATAASSSQNKSLALYVLFPAICFFSATSTVLERLVHKNAEDNNVLLTQVNNGLRPTGASVILVIAPSISLCILLFVRILFIDHFKTVPSDLDFGPKHGNPDETNIAFEPGFNTFGHCIQGVIAALFASPAVGGVLARCCRGRPLVLAAPRVWFLMLAEFASFAFTFYPAYNFVKRTMKSADTFATSSYMNNGCEWAMGALVGISLGMLVGSITKGELIHALKGTNQASDGSNDTDSYPFSMVGDYTDQKPGCFVWLCMGMARMFGVFFLISVFGAAAMTGMTWNSCEDNGKDCINYNPVQQPISVIVGLMLIPTVVCGSALILVWRGSMCRRDKSPLPLRS